MEITAPGKINLFLGVGRRRGDGYHPIESWMCTVGLFDKLVFERARRPGLDLASDASGLSVGPDNLVRRAAEALARAGAECPAATVGGLTARLHKRIPVGAGLGGGSADAARTLLALDRLWNLNLGRTRLQSLAADLGSDVPFFMGGPSALCSGRGENVMPVARPRARCCLLILPPYPLSTPRVFERFDEPGGAPKRAAWSEDQALEAIGRWADLDAAGLMERLFNDLEPAAFALRPELGRLREELEKRLGRVVRMSGSGSTLFTLADGMEEGEALAKRVAEQDIRAMAVELGVE